MALSHENLRVYKTAIEFVAWTQPLIERLPANVSARDQLERVSTNIALNIAEANSKSSDEERVRFWQIAQGSAFECGACLDVLVARGVCGPAEVQEGKEMLESMVSMIMGLRRKFGNWLEEEGVEYGGDRFGFDEDDEKS